MAEKLQLFTTHTHTTNQKFKQHEEINAIHAYPFLHQSDQGKVRTA